MVIKPECCGMGIPSQGQQERQKLVTVSVTITRLFPFILGPFFEKRTGKGAELQSRDYGKRGWGGLGTLIDQRETEAPGLGRPYQGHHHLLCLTGNQDDHPFGWLGWTLSLRRGFIKAPIASHCHSYDRVLSY